MVQVPSKLVWEGTRLPKIVWRSVIHEVHHFDWDDESDFDTDWCVLLCRGCHNSWHYWNRRDWPYPYDIEHLASDVRYVSLYEMNDASNPV